jgi:hypothetical protein
MTPYNQIIMQTLKAALICWLLAAMALFSGQNAPIAILALTAAGFALAAISFTHALLSRHESRGGSLD